MPLHLFQLLSILLAAFLGGMFWGPWFGLTRSIATFTPETYLAITRRMAQNFEAIMPTLMPVTILSILPVLYLARHYPAVFYLNLAALLLFVVTLLVTLLIEVPIVSQVRTWTPETLPPNWQLLRDRWERFHIFRVVPAFLGLTALLIAAIF
jgi:uncharacterized membrane protein